MRNNVQVIFRESVARSFRRENPKRLWFVTCTGFCHEVESYIENHEKAGTRFDTECQDIIYDDRIVLTVRKEQGTWIIIEVTVKESITGYRPIFAWKLIKDGARLILSQFLAAWSVIRTAPILACA